MKKSRRKTDNQTRSLPVHALASVRGGRPDAYLNENAIVGGGLPLENGTIHID